MGQFSVEITRLPGSLLRGNQHPVEMDRDFPEILSATVLVDGDKFEVEGVRQRLDIGGPITFGERIYLMIEKAG